VIRYDHKSAGARGANRIAIVKIIRLFLALNGLALAAGCLAQPAQAPSIVPRADGRALSASILAQPNRLAAPVVATVSSPGPRPARLPATPVPTQPAPEIVPSAAAVPATMASMTLTLPAARPTLAAPPAQRVAILEYHYSSFEMLPTVMMQPEWFQAQMAWLALAGFHSLSSAELAGFVSGRQPAPARSVALTFDVGASHFDEYAHDIIPSLRRNHLRAIFFVMPSQTRDTCDGQIACWPSLLAWRDEGLISIESHSFMHEDYATLSPEMLAFDVAHSKAAIEAKTGQPVLGLCYPFDSVTPAALDLLPKAGYQFAVAGPTRHDRSAQWNDPQPFSLPRYYPYSGQATYPLIGGTHGQTFEQMMASAVISNW